MVKSGYFLKYIVWDMYVHILYYCNSFIFILSKKDKGILLLLS